MNAREEQLDARQQHLAAILHCTMDAIILVDGHSNITLFNQSAERMFGVKASRAVGQPLSNFLPAWGRQSIEAHQTVEGLRRGEVFPLEVSISCLNKEGA